jgi:hypothetical protein
MGAFPVSDKESVSTNAGCGPLAAGGFAEGLLSMADEWQSGAKAQNTHLVAGHVLKI